MLTPASARLFVSDNEAGIAPEIMAALIRANDGLALAYGGDALTSSLDAAFARVFEHEVSVFPVPSGTAANALAMAAVANAFSLVLCHRAAHVCANEAGASESMTPGMRFLPLDGAHGKLDAPSLATGLQAVVGDQNWVPAAVSVTQLNERGRHYDPAELTAIGSVARQHGLRLHMDGARFANAVAGLGCAPADITWRAGVDVLSFGGTKNGTMCADAVVFFDPALAQHFRRHMKRAGHNLSKTRFLGAQLHALLADGLWLRLARQANQAASALSKVLAGVDGVELLEPVDGNVVFARLPAALVQHLATRGVRLRTRSRDDAGREVVRLVAAFSTTDDDVRTLQDALT